MKPEGKSLEKRKSSGIQTAKILVIAGALFLGGCSGSNSSGRESSQSEVSVSQESSQSESGVSQESSQAAGENEGKVLIAYFAVAENSDVDAVSSASVHVDENGEAKGLLRILAEDIQAVTGGDLFSIQTSVDYPGDGNALIDYAAQEQAEDARPELTSQIENLDDYDTIFIGYPTWWYDMPQVMYSFFDAYDFSGKTIIPFNSHNGSRFSGTIDTIKELEPEAEVIEDGFTVNEQGVPEAAEDVAQWLEGLGY